MQPDAVNRRHLDRPADLADQSAKVFLKLIVRGQDRLRLAIKNLARRCQLYLPTAANTLEQPPLEFFFKTANLLADRRLRDKISLRRKGKTLQIDKIAKHFEGFDMHKAVKDKYSLTASNNKIHFIL